MEFIVLSLFFCFFVFLFSLFLLSRDDFIFLKKEISLEKIFNLALISGIVALFSARFIFVLLNPSSLFINPLAFILFPYFPGLSLAGGILGGFIFLAIYTYRKKMPVGIILDFFSVSTLCAIPFGYLGYFILTQSFNKQEILEVALFGIFSIVVLFLIQSGKNLKIKEGTLGLSFLIVFSFILLLGRGVAMSKLSFLILPESLILLCSFVVSLLFLLRQEIFSRILKK